MNEEQPRAIFGLNFLQDTKGELNEVTGAYDPAQQLWSTQGQEQERLIAEEELDKVTGGNLAQELVQGISRELPGTSNNLPKIAETPRGTATRTGGRTKTGSNRDQDSNIDGDRDY